MSITYSDYTNLLASTKSTLSLTNKVFYDPYLANTFTGYLETLRTTGLNTTTMTISPPLEDASKYRPWAGKPFAVVFDWFDGLLEVNNVPVEILLQFSIQHELHSLLGIQPFCANTPSVNAIEWTKCKQYSPAQLSWEINTLSLPYPSQWMGLYFTENTYASNQTGIENKLTYWMRQWTQNNKIPKICVFGFIDSNGLPKFNLHSNTDSISLTVESNKMPSSYNNFFVDFSPISGSCTQTRKSWTVN